MKTLCAAMFLVLGFSGLVMAEEIPGGIVFSDGKNAIYQDFASGKQVSLTADLPNVTIDGSIAISEDGAALIWFYEGKFYLRQLPDGEPYVTLPRKMDDVLQGKASSPIISVSDDGKVDSKLFVDGRLSPMSENIRNLTLSPAGSRYAFESTEKHMAWTLVEPSRPNARDENKYPKYVKKPDTYNAITFFNVSLEGGGFNRFGNTAEYPPTLPFRTTHESIGVVPNRNVNMAAGILLSGLSTPDDFAGFDLTVEEACRKYGIKRDAHFLVWQKTTSWKPFNQMIALIYQTQNGWGPIEIRDINPNRNRPPSGPGYERDIKPDIKPGVYEIPVSLKHCDGLAWKPDGSLSYLSEGKVFSIDGRCITEGVENSGIAKNPSPKCYIPIAVNNVLAISGVLIAEGIQGDKLHWVSDDIFLFRGKDKALYCWRQGKVEKLLPSVPEELSFCSTAPQQTIPTKELVKVTSEPSKEVVGKKTEAGMSTTGKSGVIGKCMEPSNKYNPRYNFDITAVDIKILCSAKNMENIDETTRKVTSRLVLSVWTCPVLNGVKCEYVLLPDKTNLEVVDDPGMYQYKTDDRVMLHHVEINRIVIIRTGDKCAAIRPIEIHQNPNGLSLTYEWKYWPTASAQAVARVKSQ